MSLLRKIQMVVDSSEVVQASVYKHLNVSLPSGDNAPTAPSMCNYSNHYNKKTGENTLVPVDGQSEFDAFLYIVIVLLFYAMCMVLLMVKYIKRENEEAELDKMYVDFVKREKYSKPYQQIDHRTDKMSEYVKRTLKLFNNKRGITEDLPLLGDLIYHETSV